MGTAKTVIIVADNIIGCSGKNYENRDKGGTAFLKPQRQCQIFGFASLKVNWKSDWTTSE